MWMAGITEKKEERFCIKKEHWRGPMLLKATNLFYYLSKTDFLSLRLRSGRAVFRDAEPQPSFLYKGIYCAAGCGSTLVNQMNLYGLQTVTESRSA